MSLKQHLHKSTWPLHEWLEEVGLLQSLNEKDFTQDSYYSLLVCMYSVVLGVGQNLSKYKDQFMTSGLIDIDARLQKLSWIEQDLQELAPNKNIQNIQPLGLQTINSFSSAVGVLYVIEGSTMGAMQVHPMLKNLFGDDVSAVFYAGYGPKTIPMWKTFCEYLDRLEIDVHEATLGACELFIKIRKLLDEQ